MSAGIVDVRFPRVLRIVERYVGQKHLARRYVQRAAEGQQLYVEIVREAFKRRHRKGGHLRCVTA